MKLLLPDEVELIKKIEHLTGSNYELVGETISSDNLLVLINELWSMYEGLDDDMKALERYVEDNYKVITKEEEIYG